MMSSGKGMDIGFIGGTNPGRYPKINNEATYNMVVEEGAFVPFAGYRTVKALGANTQSRGIYSSVLYHNMVIVVNETVYAVSESLGTFKIGTLNTRSGDVYVADNGNSQIAISDLSFYYVYNYQTNVFEEFDLGFTPGQIWPQGGRIFVAVLGKATFRYTAPNAALVLDVRDGGEIGNDLVQGGCGLGNLVFVMGAKVTQIWRNLGTATAPYKLDTSVNILYGTANRNSIASGFNKVAWLGFNNEANYSILVSDGGLPKAISPPGIDFLISRLKDPNNCTGFLFEEDGHTFYQITFLDPDDSVTLVYDFQTGLFFNATDPHMKAHIAKKVVFFSGEYYFISNQNSNLYLMSSGIYTYDGEIIPRVRVTRSFRLPTYEFFRVNKIELIAEQGETDLTMNVDLNISKNSGRTFGNAMRRQLAPLGERSNVTRWWKMGRSNDWTFQFRFYGAFRFVLLGVAVEAQ